MTDNQTTELREKLDALGIEHTDASYKRKVPITVWNSNGAIFCFVDDSNQIDLHIENPTPEQAIAATMGSRTANVDDILELLDEMNHVESISYDVYSQLHDAIAELGSETCELAETESYNNTNEVIHVLECSACGKTCEYVNGSYPRCPHCGRKAVER